MASKTITDVVKKVNNFITISAPAPLQEAVTVGLNFKKEYYDSLLEKYTNKRNLICKGLDDIGIEYFKPEGTYFVLIDLKEYVKKSGLDNDLEFAKMMCEKCGVALVPAGIFFADNGKTNGIFRLHFAKNDDTLNEALNRISTIKNII